MNFILIIHNTHAFRYMGLTPVIHNIHTLVT